MPNPQKIMAGGSEFDIYPAQVISVDYGGTNIEHPYSIKCNFVGPFGSNSPSDVIVAKPIDINIKNIPISGEVVMLLKAPNSYATPARVGSEYYYTNAISLQGSVHHNGLPGLTEFIQKKSSVNKQIRNEVEDGISVKSSEVKEVQTTIDPLFPERLDVYPVQPYPGDIIIEGRFGQSIRLGSTINEDSKYPLSPYWKDGTGASGNPITIISNGTNPKRGTIYNTFILENPDNDDSCIWLTSGQNVSFTPSSNYAPSIEDKGVDLFKKNGYSGNQAIIASDRIILNARKQEIIGFSKEGIGFSSEKIFSIDAKEVVEIESKLINLGLNAEEPVLMGQTTIDWLKELCDVLKSLTNDIKAITVPTGVGPSGTPINGQSFTVINNDINALSSRIDDLKSELVFLNKKSTS